MSKPHLVLLHAPSVYDFRKRASFHGPISDLVPSAPVFEMYPIGYMTILGYLEAHGYSVRIINVALKMLKSRHFDAEKLIKSLNPMAFGIGLHWLPHAHGSLELAKIVKKYHPHTPVVFGGLSATYYHEELIAYRQVDYVIRGDSAEEPLRQLLHKIERGDSPDDVPNLTWRDNQNEIRINEFSHAPNHLDYLPFDYNAVIKSVLRYGDLIGHLPFRRWLDDPIVLVLPVRGCTQNCAICGGGAQCYSRLFQRKSPAYRSPYLIAKDISLATRYLKAPIAIIGDIRQAGEEYARQLLNTLRTRKGKSHIVLELFYPAHRKFLQSVASAVPNFYIQISPESHDELIRKASGRHYDNQGLEQTIQDALRLGCKRVDVFFLIGLPKQTVQSVRETIAYCETLLERFNKHSDNRIHPYISPVSPFLDPGSPAFEDPEKYGYRLFCRTLEEHRRALLQPSWKYMLNYETRWMSRDELVDCTYEAALELNRLKAEYGLLPKKQAKKVEQMILKAKELIEEVDNIISKTHGEVVDRKLQQLRVDFEKVSSLTDWEKELQWPQGDVKRKFRVKLASVDIAKIEKVCRSIEDIAKRCKVNTRGPVTLSGKKLRLAKSTVARKHGKRGYEISEARVHTKHVDVDLNERALKFVVQLQIPEGLNIEIVLIEESLRSV